MMISTAPHRTNGVDHPLGAQMETGRNLSLPRWTTMQLPAIGKQPWSSCAMDGPVNAATAE